MRGSTAKGAEYRLRGERVSNRLRAAHARHTHMHRIGLLLAGCGELDGSDPAQVAAVWARVEAHGAELVACAPDIPQRDVFHPLSGAALPPRNALAESARLVRSACRPVSAVTAHHVDALVIPGGLGVVKTLCDAGVVGTSGAVEPQIARLLHDLRQAQRPMVALGEAVVLLALARPNDRLRLACGADPALSALVQHLGHAPQATGVSELVIEDDARVVSACPRMGLLVQPAMDAAEAAVNQLFRWLASA